MGLRINTNMAAINANRNLRTNQAQIGETFEKLSSGKQINKSKDDAAGLAISESLGTQVRSLKQAGRNAQDGISVIQVAEGGMAEVTNIVTRLRELSIQAASDTVGNQERSYLNVEAQQLKSEIERIAQSTEFNGLKLLSGAGQKLDFQVGIRNDDFLDRISYDPSQANVNLDSLGLSGIDLSSKNSSQTGLAAIDESIHKVNANRSTLGALQSRLEKTVSAIEVANENLSAAKSRILDADYG